MRDLGSRHGTRHNGRAVTESALQGGDVVRAGDSLFLFERLRFDRTATLAPPAAPLWGPSFGLQRLRGDIPRVAQTDIPVLIRGETGTGKELAARAVHEASGRTGPFVAVNCSALPSELAERELFGSTKGAFTGANADHRGLVREADGGTLFLDEIGELPPLLQPKLLRFLAEGEVRPVGAARSETVDVRVLAATHALLEDPASFRPDLLARLQGWTLEIPPLRDRRADVLPLAQRFGLDPVHPDVAEALVLYAWPANVRELRQVVHEALLRADGRPATVADLRDGIGRRPEEGSGPAGSVPLALEIRATGTPSARELRRALDHHGGNVAQVAAFFQRDRKQVYRWMARYGIESGR